MRPILCTVAPGVHRLAITTPRACRSSRPLQTPPRGNMTCTRDKARLLCAPARRATEVRHATGRQTHHHRSRYARWQVVCARAAHHRLRRARLARGGDERAGHPYGLSRARAGRHPRLCCICRPIDTAWLDPGKSACNSGGRSRQVLVKQQFHAATRITCSSRSALESAGDQMYGRERRRRDRRLLSALRFDLDGPDLAATASSRPRPTAVLRS